jgi:hypothetical protein
MSKAVRGLGKRGPLHHQPNDHTSAALNAGCDSRSFSSGDVGRHKGTLFLGPGVARIGAFISC